MKKYLGDVLAIAGIFFVVVVFFYKTIFYGLLPIPSDALVGMYHPWRDAYAHTFTNGVPFKNFLITDPVRQQIPWRKQVIDAFKSKKFPLWNAASFSGTPLLANIQSGALYPLNVLFFVFPFATAWTILIISQPLLAGIFLFLFLRHKLDPISSLIGAVCFAFSGFSVSWLTWGTMVSTILWLPLALLAFERIHESSKKTPWRLLFIFAVVSSFFAGHIQIFVYCMLVFGAYAVFLMRKMNMQKPYLMHIVIPGIILGITSIVWFRLISFFPGSSRIAGSSWTVEGFFIPLRHLIQFIIPDYFGNPATLNYWGIWNYGEMIGYIGVIGLLLALIGISVKSRFWVGVVCLSLLFAVDSPIARLPFILHIPGISSLQPTRLLSIIDLGLSILAAYGASRLFSLSKKQKMCFLTAVGFSFGIAWFSVDNIVTRRNLILPTGIFVIAVIGIVASMFVQKRKWIQSGILCLLLVVSVFDVLRFGWKFTPFTDASFFFPETEIITRLKQLPKPFRVVAVDDRLLPPNVLSYYDIESISGYDPIHTLRYEEYIAAMERGEPNIKPPFGFTRIIAPKTITSPLLALLNVNYILSMDPLTGSNVRLLAEEGRTKLYKYVGGVPRVYLAEQIITESSKEAVIRQLYEPSFIPGKTVILESPLSIVSVPLGIEESAVISSYEGDGMKIQTTTKNTRLLVIGNMMDPHWKVTIDGKYSDILRVNYLFFGILVPAGTHTVAVQYK